jgi:hypothetical protein
MGIFSFYNGWIYNEFFAIPIDAFGSCYEKDPAVLYSIPDKVYGYKRIKEGFEYCVYPFGFDPRWP